MGSVGGWLGEWVDGWVVACVGAWRGYGLLGVCLGITVPLASSVSPAKKHAVLMYELLARSKNGYSYDTKSGCSCTS